MTSQLLDISFVKFFMAKSVGTLNPKMPITVHVDDKIESVLKILKQYNIGCSLVINESGKLVGIFTERDALRRDQVWKNRDLTVGEVMTKAPHVEEPTTSVAHIMLLMSQGGFRHIPLVDSDGRPVGLVSVRDILDHFSNTLDQYYDQVTALAQQVIAERATKDAEKHSGKPRY